MKIYIVKHLLHFLSEIQLFPKAGENSRSLPRRPLGHSGPALIAPGCVTWVLSRQRLRQTCTACCATDGLCRHPRIAAEPWQAVDARHWAPQAAMQSGNAPASRVAYNETCSCACRDIIFEIKPTRRYDAHLLCSLGGVLQSSPGCPGLSMSFRVRPAGFKRYTHIHSLLRRLGPCSGPCETVVWAGVLLVRGKDDSRTMPMQQLIRDHSAATEHRGLESFAATRHWLHKRVIGTCWHGWLPTQRINLSKVLQRSARPRCAAGAHFVKPGVQTLMT
jgi:hypothetical protein